MYSTAKGEIEIKSMARQPKGSMTVVFGNCGYFNNLGIN
jgi:hypothetical protein